MSVPTPEERIRALLDGYFARLRAGGWNRYPAKSDPDDGGGVPRAMFDGDVDREGIVSWKVLPSTLTDAAIARLEKRARGPFPPPFRAYLKYGHFMGVHAGGAGLPGTPADFPLRDLERWLDGCREIIDAGYVAFASDDEDIGMLCFDYGERLPDGDCPIVLFDHEDIVNLDDPDRHVRARVEPHARAFAPSFAQFAAKAFAV